MTGTDARPDRSGYRLVLQDDVDGDVLDPGWVCTLSGTAQEWTPERVRFYVDEHPITRLETGWASAEDEQGGGGCGVGGGVIGDGQGMDPAYRAAFLP